MKKLLVSVIGVLAVVVAGVGVSSADVSVYAPVCPKADVRVAGQQVIDDDKCAVDVTVSTTIPTP